MKAHKTNKMTIEILSNTVKLINHREDNKIYEFELIEFNQLLKYGAKQYPLKNANGGKTPLTFVTKNKHLSSAGGGINTSLIHIYSEVIVDLDEAEKSFIEDMSQEDQDLLYGDWLDD